MRESWRWTLRVLTVIGKLFIMLFEMPMCFLTAQKSCSLSFYTHSAAREREKWRCGCKKNK